MFPPPSHRLANLDHSLKVLLIEAGENNLNNPWVYRPGIYPRNMKLDSKTATFYESRPSKWLGGRGAIVPAAHVLGGGSSINFMVTLWAKPNRLCSKARRKKIRALTFFFFSPLFLPDVHPRLGVRLR